MYSFIFKETNTFAMMLWYVLDIKFIIEVLQEGWELAGTPQYDRIHNTWVPIWSIIIHIYVELLTFIAGHLLHSKQQHFSIFDKMKIHYSQKVRDFRLSDEISECT